MSKELEKLRVADVIGASLEAEVDVYCDKTLYSDLDSLEDELRFVFITSAARIHPAEDHPEGATQTNGFWLTVEASKHPKCIRCWHHREEVGQHVHHPQLCARCVENVNGSGEQRRYA